MMGVRASETSGDCEGKANMRMQSIASKYKTFV